MSTEAPPKRESHTGWIVGVAVLLLLAAAIPIGLKLYGPREMVMDLQGDPGGKVVWHFYSADRTTQTGVTNLPVKLIFHARIMEFTAQRTNYTGPLQLNVLVGGASRGSVSMGGTGGVRFFHTWNGWGVSGTP